MNNDAALHAALNEMFTTFPQQVPNYLRLMRFKAEFVDKSASPKFPSIFKFVTEA